MNWFPQIGAGSVAQFPVTRSRKWRAIANTLESDGQNPVAGYNRGADRVEIILSGTSGS